MADPFVVGTHPQDRCFPSDYDYLRHRRDVKGGVLSHGVRQINPLYFEAELRSGSGKTFTRVVIPGSLPMIMTGCASLATARW